MAIDAPCSGNASCGKCLVQLKSGELDSKRTLHIGDEEYAEGWRLACTSTVCADVTVLVPDIASAYKSRMKVADLSSKEEIAIFENAKRDIELTGIQLRNSLDVVEVTMDPPTLDDTMPDNERLYVYLLKFINLPRVRIPYTTLRKLPDVLRESNYKVKCILRTTSNDMFVYDVYGWDEKVVVGGTGCGYWNNHRIRRPDQYGKRRDPGQGFYRKRTDPLRCGRDHRIIEQQKPGGKKKLQDAVIDETINPMIHEMCKSAGIKSSQIYRLSIAGNTTMNHLFAGLTRILCVWNPIFLPSLKPIPCSLPMWGLI